jgi:hypothetical protein
MDMDDAREDYIQILRPLLLLYRTTPNRDSRRLHPDYQRVGHLAHGWYMRCLRGCEALLLLADAGYSEEGSGIRRSIIEHVTALKWLAADGNQIEDTVARGHANNIEHQRKVVIEANWTSVDIGRLDEILLEIDKENRLRENDQFLHHMQRVSKYDDVHSLPGYVAESAKTHPSHESAMSYVAVPDLMMLDEPREDVNQMPFATSHLLEATLAFRVVFVAPPWRQTLIELLTQFREITNRVREQDGLASVDWPVIDIP